MESESLPLWIVFFQLTFSNESFSLWKGCLKSQFVIKKVIIIFLYTNLHVTKIYLSTGTLNTTMLKTQKKWYQIQNFERMIKMNIIAPIGGHVYYLDI